MRIVPLLLVTASLAAPRVGANDFIDFLPGHRELEVIAVTDTTPAGRALPAASEELPQYGIGLGFDDLGAPIGGIKEPPTRDALRFIAAEPAKRDCLPAMPAIAGPNFGRETARPVWTRAPEKFQPNVRLGEIRPVEYPESSPLPVVESSTEPKKPKR